MCIDMCLYSYRDDLPKNLFKITAQVCKKSTSSWRPLLKNLPIVVLYVRSSNTVVDAGIHAVDSGFQVLDSGFHVSEL